MSGIAFVRLVSLQAQLSLIGSDGRLAESAAIGAAVLEPKNIDLRSRLSLIGLDLIQLDQSHCLNFPLSLSLSLPLC